MKENKSDKEIEA